MIAATVLMMFGCKDPYLPETPVADYVGQEASLKFFGDDYINVDKYGGDYTTTFTSNLPWMMESSNDWITITSPDRGTGSTEVHTIAFTVKKNASVNPREGKIRIWIDNAHEAYIRLKQGEMTLEELANKYYVKVGGTGDGSSWAMASGDLSKILENAANGDKVYVGAGRYTPSTLYPGAPDEKGACFFVSGNIGLYGGYPADAKDGDVADPTANPTILDGKLKEGNSHHVLIVAAAEDPLFKLEVNGFEIINGSSYPGGGNVVINSGRLYGYQGGGLCIINSKATVKNCVIRNNSSPKGTGGVYIGDGSTATLEDCVIADNTGYGNGPGLANSAATMIMNRCIVERSLSENGGVSGGIYLYDQSGAKRATISYIYNSVIRDNDNKSGAASRVGAGIYAREGSKTYIVNTTVNGNLGGGAAVACYGTTAAKSEMTVISSTITANTSKFVGGGLQSMPFSTVKAYNSIISGNTVEDPAATSSDVLTAKNATAPMAFYNTVVTGDVYGNDGGKLSGYLFDPATMFLKSGNYFALGGDPNPARTMGMTGDEIKALPEAADLNQEWIANDAAGADRKAKVMGAYIGN